MEFLFFLVAAHLIECFFFDSVFGDSLLILHLLLNFLLLYSQQVLVGLLEGFPHVELFELALVLALMLLHDLILHLPSDQLTLKLLLLNTLDDAHLVV